MKKKFNQTTEKICEQFMECIQYNNGKIPNISQLCDYCQINRKTFYAHFESIDELVSYITITEQLILKSHYENYMKIDLTRNPNLMVHYFNQYMIERENFYRIVFLTHSVTHIYDEIFEFFCSILDPVFEPMKFTSHEEMSIVIRCFSYALFAPYQYAAMNHIAFNDESLKRMTEAGFNIHEYIKI